MKFHGTLKDSFQMYNLTTSSIYFSFPLKVKAYKDHNKTNSSLPQGDKTFFTFVLVNFSTV